MKLGRFYTWQEKREIEEDAIKRGFWCEDPRVFVPGSGWEIPWYWDQRGDFAAAGFEPMITERGQLGFLSRFYWRDWADKRPPIAIMCPNGRVWEIDRKSSNGDGWTVTGQWPLITCAPSIDLAGYHGFLRNGEFTKDLANRGPDGFGEPYVPTPRTV